MRYSILAFAATVLAQSSESASSSSISTVPYSNPATQYLTQTNSLGVVTGQPTLDNGGLPVTTQPAVNTDVGTVATIPAGLPTGITSVPIATGNGTAAHYFTVSVGSSTTVVLGAIPTGVSVSGVSPTGSAGSGSSNDSNNSDSPSGTSNGSPSGTASASADTSSGAANANNMVGASGAILGMGALIAAWL